MLKSASSPHNDVFLTQLRRSRESKRVRQADLAVRLGRGQATISKVERGERRLDIIELRTWLDALGVDFVGFIRELDNCLRPMQAIDPALRAKRPRTRSN